MGHDSGRNINFIKLFVYIKKKLKMNIIFYLLKYNI